MCFGSADCGLVCLTEAERDHGGEEGNQAQAVSVRRPESEAQAVAETEAKKGEQAVRRGDRAEQAVRPSFRF